MPLAQGRFKGRLSRFILQRHGIDRTLTRAKLDSALMIWVMFLSGLVLIGLQNLLPLTGFSADFKTAITIVLKGSDSLAGALIGAAAALAASRIISQDEELLALVAAGSMTQSSVSPTIVKLFQRKFVMFHTTRQERGVVGLSRGFQWKKASIDLSAPAPGMLLGTYTCDHQVYIVEGYVRHKLLVLHVIAHPDQEIIESAFLFPLAHLHLPAYGSGYHMTEAGLTDIALSPAIICVDDTEVDEKLLVNGSRLPLGIVTDVKRQYVLDNAWWNKHRIKILPRIYPQISATYASVGNIDGEWLFRYVLIYDQADAPAHLLMNIQKSGARYLITPSAKETPCAFPNPSVHGSIEWMAEMRALQPECMSGRWWGLPTNDRTGSAPEYEAMGVLATEGTLLLNVDVNYRGLHGIFVARSGLSPHVLGVIAGVRYTNDDDAKQDIASLFKVACRHAERASKNQAS